MELKIGSSQKSGQHLNKLNRIAIEHLAMMLHTNKFLVFLDISGLNMSGDFLKQLAEVGNNNGHHNDSSKDPVLEVLNLAHTDISSLASHQSLRQFLFTFKNLVELNLSHNNFGFLPRSYVPDNMEQETPAAND